MSDIELREAIGPVADWYDIDGEEGEPVTLLQVVADIAKTLVQEREDTIRLRQALQAIIKHQEMVGGSMSDYSTTRAIAIRALNQGATSGQ